MNGIWSSSQKRKLTHCAPAVGLVALFVTILAQSADVRAEGATRGALRIPVSEQYLLLAANQDRAAHGLGPVAYDPSLSVAASMHAREMAAHGTISHQFPGEMDLSERASRYGVRFSLITENVAIASTSAEAHSLWMASPGHRANLLDPKVNTIGIAVLMRGDEAFAVEDFASKVENRTIEEQEKTVSRLIGEIGPLTVELSRVEARATCVMSTGYAGSRRPAFIMRYTSSTLDDVPAELRRRIESGRYHAALVGACPATDVGPFAAYNLAVLLYP